MPRAGAVRIARHILSSNTTVVVIVIWWLSRQASPTELAGEVGGVTGVVMPLVRCEMLTSDSSKLEPPRWLNSLGAVPDRRDGALGVLRVQRRVWPGALPVRCKEPGEDAGPSHSSVPCSVGCDAVAPFEPGTQDRLPPPCPAPRGPPVQVWSFAHTEGPLHSSAALAWLWWCIWAPPALNPGGLSGLPGAPHEWPLGQEDTERRGWAHTEAAGLLRLQPPIWAQREVTSTMTPGGVAASKLCTEDARSHIRHR